MRNSGIEFSKKRPFTYFLALALCLLLVGCAAHQPSMEEEPIPATEITSVAVSSEGDQVNVNITGTGPLDYSSVKQPMPLGVVLYFSDAQLSAFSDENISSLPPVMSVHATQVESNQGITTRIAILLAADVPYQVVQGDHGIQVQFSKTGTLSDVQQSASNPPAESRIATAAGTFQGTGTRVKKESQIWVNRIDFLGEPDGRSVLAIETTSPATYDIRKVSNTLLELRLTDVNIADFRQRPLVTTRFESAVDQIVPVQLPSMKDSTIFSIELREPVSYYAEQTGNILEIHFDASSVPPAPMNEAKLPSWKKALSEPINTNDVNPLATPVAAAAGTVDVAAPFETPEVVLDVDQAMVLRKQTKQYTGEKIALDFYQTDIKNVFRILREVSGKNFAIDKDVSGRVTLTLDKPVPWDQIMDLVLRMNQLGMIVEGDIVRIATLSTLKHENDLRNAQMAALQREKEQVKALEPLETRYIPISYSDARSEVLPHIQNISTKNRGSVSVDQKNNQIIITDTAEKIAQAQEIARQIDKVTAQVIIEARVVEVNETFSKELGISWSGTVDHTGNKFVSGGSVAMDYPTASQNGLGFSLERIVGTPFSIDARLTALESSGNARILSAPKIVTLNNKKAKIKQGREYGYMERDSAGGSSVEFKDVDLLLEVTPHITPDNRISMAIMITKNDVVELIDGVPVISTNEAETQLLVNDGDTIVIGGIIKNTTSKSKDAFPGLHKIPIIGWLFQANFDETDNSELLIFMNPKIVQLEQRPTIF